MAKIATLTDDFATADGAKWTGYGASVTVASGQLSIVPDATFARAIYSVASYDVAASEAVIEVVAVGSSQILSLSLQNSNNWFDLQYDNGNMRMRELVGGVPNDTTTPYSSVNHRWWRIREAGGTVYWEASADGVTWNTLRTKTWAVPAISAMTASVVAYTTSGTTAALLDNFNLASAPPAGTPKIATLTDDYATADGAKWDGYNANVTVAGGQLSMVPDATFARELISDIPYDVAASEALIEVASLGSCVILSFNLQDSSAPDNRLDLQYDSGVMRMRELVAGVISDTTVTYNAVNHRWWRIREAGGTVYWEASPTGASGTWTVLRSKVWAVPAVSSMQMSIIAYTTSGTTPALLDNFNLSTAVSAGAGSSWWMHFLRGAPQSAPAAPAGGPFTKAYYVSNTGNDNNVGTSPAAPWATIVRAMQASYNTGEAILLERGGTFYGGYFNETPSVVAGQSRWTIGAYGSGARPILTAYKLLNNSGAWVNTGGNIWRIDLTNAATHGGLQGQPGGVIAWNIGHLRVGSALYGVLRGSTAALSGQWDFFCQNPYTYVYSVGNPTTVAGGSGLRAAPQCNIIQCHQNTEINGIEIEGSGGHAIATTSSGVVSNILVTDCLIHNLGGSILFGTTRYGNGIEFWMGTSNATVQDTEIAQCYDAGLTVQGGGANASNITFQRLNVHDNSFNYELFNDSGVMSNILYINNVSTNGSGGWAGPLRPNQDTRGTHVAFTGPLNASGCQIRNNVFIGGAVGGLSGSYVFSISPFPKTGVAMYSNDIRLPSGKRINWFTQHLITQGAAYQAATGMELGSPPSTFTVL